MDQINVNRFEKEESPKEKANMVVHGLLAIVAKAKANMAVLGPMAFVAKEKVMANTTWMTMTKVAMNVGPTSTFWNAVIEHNSNFIMLAPAWTLMSITKSHRFPGCPLIDQQRPLTRSQLIPMDLLSLS